MSLQADACQAYSAWGEAPEGGPGCLGAVAGGSAGCAPRVPTLRHTYFRTGSTIDLLSTVPVTAPAAQSAGFAGAQALRLRLPAPGCKHTQCTSGNRCTHPGAVACTGSSSGG